jgi:hypothetical protein
MFIKNIIYKIVFLLVGVIIGVGGTFLYIQKYGVPFEKVLQNISKVNEEKKIAEILEKVGKLTILPAGEKPVLATITDIETLIKEQPFYVGAENGDVVLIYQKSLKAIIYSPKRNIIVNIGPVSIEPENQKTLEPTVDNIIIPEEE